MLVGLLIGIAVTICVYGTARSIRSWRLRRRWRRPAPRPARPVWNVAPVPDRPGGGINDYLDGRRVRPDFNRAPGPRDW
jgi:hypothetical protein